jgi:hypothetical protein
MDACGSACDVEPAPEEKRLLAGTSLLFGQVAEHLERGNALTPEILERCHYANSLIRDEHVRSRIAALLFEAVTARQPDRSI